MSVVYAWPATNSRIHHARLRICCCTLLLQVRYARQAEFQLFRGTQIGPNAEVEGLDSLMRLWASTPGDLGRLLEDAFNSA